MYRNLEESIRELLSALEKIEIEEAIDNLEKNIKKLIIKNRVFNSICNEKFSLSELKKKIDFINRNSRNLSLEMIKESRKLYNQLDNDLNFKFYPEIEKIRNLIETYIDINKIFDYSKIKKEELDDLSQKLEDLINYHENIQNNDFFPNIISKLDENLKIYSQTKETVEKKLLEYFNSFTDQKFVKKLIKGEELSIEDLNPDVYKEIYENTSLRKKVKIFLKKE
ncbi:MAG: hypothetical protein ACTSVV_08265 [Promethearchaeota archaeon]